MTHAVFAPVLDPAQARRANRQTCLLLNLTNDGICKGFTLFNMTARKKQRLASWDLCGPAPKPCCRGGARTYSSVRRAQSVSCTTRPFGFENLLAIHDYCALCGTFALALSLSARTAKDLDCAGLLLGELIFTARHVAHEGGQRGELFFTVQKFDMADAGDGGEVVSALAGDIVLVEHTAAVPFQRRRSDFCAECRAYGLRVRCGRRTRTHRLHRHSRNSAAEDTALHRLPWQDGSLYNR